MKRPIPENLNAHPSVFAVEDRYEIITPFASSSVVWVKVGNEEYYDDSNGILKSGNYVHKVEVPMTVLDEAEEYTLCYRKMIDRKPYFPESEETVELTYKFKPIKGDRINIYHISDAHNFEEEPISAGSYFGDALDLLVLNGDIPNHSGDIANFNSIYRIASGLTEGTRPVVFSRGNHDTRGIYGESFGEYTPNNHGKPYYTFTLGSLWGLVLDCGEDKNDDHAEYGHTTCFHRFRLRETEFIKEVIAKKEYEGKKHKVVICHVPFCYIQNPPFDIEKDLYREWTRMIGESIKPEIMLFGHTHRNGIYYPGGELDSYGLQSSVAIVGGQPDFEKRTYEGCAITLSEKEPEIVFTKNC